MEQHSFLGKGWRFPVEPDPATGRIRMCDGNDDIADAIRLILNTKRGERVMRSDFGSGLSGFAFEAPSQAVCSELVDEVKSSLILYEPRIQDIDVTIENSEMGMLKLLISYTVRATNSPYNLVFPFYLEEGGYADH